MVGHQKRNGSNRSRVRTTKQDPKSSFKKVTNMVIPCDNKGIVAMIRNLFPRDEWSYAITLFQ